MLKAIRVLFVAALCGTALMAAAQDAVQVQVPFDFQVRGKTLHAGTYTVGRVNDVNPLMLSIKGTDGQAAIPFVVNAEAWGGAGSSLYFRRYGDSYFLSGVRTPSAKYSVPHSKQEKILAMKDSATEVTVGSN